MPIDRDALRQASERASQRMHDRAPTGVAAMLAGLHKGALVSFVTVESVALPPVPEPQEGRWTLVVLLAIPAGPGGSEAGLLPPWGFVRWNADGSVNRAERLPVRPDVGSYAGNVDGSALARLLTALDAVLQGPTDADLSPIVPLYAALMPPEVVPIVHALAPSTRTWLG